MTELDERIEEEFKKSIRDYNSDFGLMITFGGELEESKLKMGVKNNGRTNDKR